MEKGILPTNKCAFWMGFMFTIVAFILAGCSYVGFVR